MKPERKKIIISGGGTGGHVFPAIAIANALKEKNPEMDILFVGAKGKMEMEKVPAAGYSIVGIPVQGLHRRLTLKNMAFLPNLLISLWKASRIIRRFRPDAVIGVGGFASGPVLYIASKRNIPVLIQEQNSYPGITNRILAKRADKICVAYEGMEKHFPKEKIIITGNPVRQNIFSVNGNKTEALHYFNLKANKKILLVIGGSLGARTINNSIYSSLDEIVKNHIQLIWQTGKAFYDKAHEKAALHEEQGIRVTDFISRMDLAFILADTVISRAGAISISELCLVKKPTILVPSPNVAEDHQTKNAMALVKSNAAMMIYDFEAPTRLVHEALSLIQDDFRKKVYAENMGKMAVRNSAELIIDEIYKLIEGK